MMLNIFYDLCISNGIPCKRVHFHEFILDVHVQLHKLRKEYGSIPDLMEKVADHYYAQTPVFAFDECHVLNVSDAMVMKGCMIALFERGCVVVATSNLDPLSLYASGLNREVFYPFLKALQDNMVVWDMDSKVDFRQEENENRRTVGMYLTPEKFESTYAALFTSFLKEKERIDLPFGRELDTDVLTSDADDDDTKVAMFDFVDLCENSLGAPEYVALTDNFAYVVVKDLPVFTPESEDAARRFVIFLDIMYDKKMRIILTSKFSPDEVFAKLEEKYASDLLAGSEAMSRETDDRQSKFTGAISVSDQGGSSGKHATVFQVPTNMSYGEKNEYKPGEVNDESATETNKKGLGWVEWSATGLKGASLYDLTGHLPEQQKDRLLPLLRCKSRLVELQKSSQTKKTTVRFLSDDEK